MKYPTLNYSRLVLVMTTLSVYDNNSASSSNHLRFNSVFYERLSYAVTVGGSPEAVDFQLKKYDVAKRKFLGLKIPIVRLLIFLRRRRTYAHEITR